MVDYYYYSKPFVANSPLERGGKRKKKADYPAPKITTIMNSSCVVGTPVFSQDNADFGCSEMLLAQNRAACNKPH